MKKQLWINLIFLTTVLISQHSLNAQGYSPEKAVGEMDVLSGFKVELVAAEPQVRQPVAIDFDDRGRLWVLQYLQYPNPAGLKRVKVDRYSRTTYDRVPKPPPYGPQGADRLTILEDLDEDGICENSKDFISSLNITTGFAFGHNGVFVLQVPYLLFYPDKNKDDIPDTEPQVLLKGFGMEDTSSLANSLIFGPDGWLYGTQGTNITAKIRGVEFEQGVWRYHLPTDRFELFCEGGGNSWGLDFDQEGNLLYSTNHGGYLMHHGIQGAYYEKSFAKHGELHNPFSFGYFPHVPHQNFKGGHVTVGGFVYRGNAFPKKFQNKYISVDTLGHAVHFHSIHKNGSTFKTAYAGTFVDANDNWFAPSDAVLAPDGSVYFCDWHDKRTAHPDPDADWDRTNGRIYRLVHQPALKETHLDPASLSSRELLKWLSSPNEWKVRRARRVISEREDRSVVGSLNPMIYQANQKLNREAFWTLAGLRNYEKDVPVELLNHKDEVIRSWAIRLMGDVIYHSEGKTKLSKEWQAKLIQMAETDKSNRVISQLACTAKRLNGKIATSIIFSLSHRNEFVVDPYIPLLIWWALEKHSMEQTEGIVNQFSNEKFRQRPLVSQFLTGRLMNRYAGDGTVEGLIAAAKLLKSVKGKQDLKNMLADMDDGLKMIGNKKMVGLTLNRSDKKNKDVDNISKVLSIPVELSLVLQRLWDKDQANPLLLRILIRLGNEDAHKKAISLLLDFETDKRLKCSLFQIFEELGEKESIEPMLSILQKENSKEDIQASLKVLRRFSDHRITITLIKLYSRFLPAQQSMIRQILLSRKESAFLFLKEIDAGKYQPEEIPDNQLKILALHENEKINALVQKHWGLVSARTSGEKLAEIRRITNDLRAGTGNSGRGKELFIKHCSTCHRMYAEGKEIGPDLTRANRTDQLFLLTSIVDPNVQIRKEYLNYNVATLDGRIAVGLLKEETSTNIILLTEKNEKVVISVKDIDEFSASKTSMMPENILQKMKPQELRDLFHYLKTAKK